MRLFARVVFSLLLLAGLTVPVFAAEEIRSFDSVVEVHPDGTLRVTETISVNVEGNRISRGIFRDIPLRYENASGQTLEVGLDVVSVTRNGDAARYQTERSSGVLRIRIGNPDVLLPHTVHRYEIVYETTRQIRFFNDHDEVYWNATGNGWDFPIRSASAEIVLPAQARALDVTYFTGAYGSTEQAASAERLDGGNRVRVEADRTLGPREGLTVVVAFPKGIVAPPTAADERADWLRANLGWIVGGLGLVVVFGYYLWAWNRVGRDPPAEIVVPRWTPPDGVTPALANYIEQRGFRGQGWDAFAAAIIDLAVRGHLEIENPKRTMTIRRKGNGVPGGLGVGQRAILAALPREGNSLTVDKSNGETVQSVGSAFRRAMESEHRNQFYRSNPLYLAGGVTMSVLVILSVIASGRFAPETVAASLGVIVPAVIVALIAVNIGRQFRNARSLGARIMAVIGAAFTGFVGIAILGGVGAFLTEIDIEPRMLAAVAGLVITNIVFFYLMGAPTQIGQKKTAEIAGLKQYLTLAEKDRMNMRGAPEMSPQHFETLLPYAVALGVEKPWSRTFDAWLATAAAAGAAAYIGPSWYHGGSFSPGRIGSDLGSIAGSLSDSFTASLPAPQSSSSGFSSGGGFSGGGGGGGGGGGW